jgi:hypothetical protein
MIKRQLGEVVAATTYHRRLYKIAKIPIAITNIVIVLVR